MLQMRHVDLASVDTTALVTQLDQQANEPRHWRAATEVKNEKDREDLLEMAKAWNQLACSRKTARLQRT